MTDIETFELFGTISLGTDFMLERIYIEGRKLQLGNWFCFVPEAFRVGAESASWKVWKSAIFKQPVSESTIRTFVSLFQIRMIQAMEQGLLDNTGWRSINRERHVK